MKENLKELLKGAVMAVLQTVFGVGLLVLAMIAIEKLKLVSMCTDAKGTLQIEGVK